MGYRSVGKDQETIEGLLACLDEAVSSRDRRYESLDKQYRSDNGHILSKDYDEYMGRKESVERRFREEESDCLRKLDRLCKRIRKAQPALSDLGEDNLRLKGRFPRYIALGRLHIRYENRDFHVPRTFRFPLDQPMYICGDGREVLLHKVLLRLLYTLPIDKQQYYIFDPIGLGKTVYKLNSLFLCETLSPMKKILGTTAELKAVLKDVLKYILDLQSRVFNLDTDCPDWDTYNRRLYTQDRSENMLPYKVFLFGAVPEGMDEECFQMFKTLIEHSRQCGLLVLFSFDAALLDAEEGKMRKAELELLSCVEKSRQLHTVFEDDGHIPGYCRLSVTSVGEKFPDDKKLGELLDTLLRTADACFRRGNSFEGVIDFGALFTGSSRDGLAVPIGYDALGKGRMELRIDDETTHYFIGGTTGSGKSNLLHTLIVSACCRYSPRELRVYLLDFKDGVEFSQYADPVLRHAELVATEADAEYGVTVLEHLVRVKQERYGLFKKSRCKNIQSYRRANPTESMPRILVIMDEFQVLLAGGQKEQAVTAMEILAKQGRACGIHLILATQSLKGLDFSTLSTQFGGRIALKCSAEDSKTILGGVTSNNEEAAALNVPYAILNTQQGSVSGNEKFAVPWTKEEYIARAIDAIARKCDAENIPTATKIFEGQNLPARPKSPDGAKDGLFRICLGEKMEYSAEPFILTLRPRAANNVLLCGHDDSLKSSMLKSVLLACARYSMCEEIIYIGDAADTVGEDIRRKVKCLLSVAEFADQYKESLYEKKKVVILDNCNLTKDIGYQPVMYGTPPERAAVFKDFIENANINGCYLIAFYEGKNRIRNCGIPKDEFNYRIGYAVNSDEKNDLLGSGAMSNAPVKSNRAFAVDNLELCAWFRPYTD